MLSGYHGESENARLRMQMNCEKRFRMSQEQACLSFFERSRRAFVGVAMCVLLCAAALATITAPSVALAAQPNPLDHAALAEKYAAEQAKDEKSDATDAEGSATGGIDMLALANRAAAARAWSLTPSGFVAQDGQTIIPGALAKGIDVSEHQGEIDWEAVKADGVTFAILRVGYGGDYSDQDDKCFAYNVSECERLGIPYGVYLYSYAYDAASARSEANHVYYDLEYTSNGSPAGNDGSGAVSITNDDLSEFATIFCNVVSEAGFTPGIYANLNWWNNYLTDSCFSRWERWVAQYNNYCSYQGEYKVWQSASDASVAGVNGYVDVDFDYYPYRGGAGYKRADLNMNGSVNVVDAQIAYDLACGNTTVRQKFLAQGVAWTDKTVRYFVDVNGDGSMDASDALAIQWGALHGTL